MSNTIILRNSLVPSQTPGLGSISPGEVCVNVADGLVFFKQQTRVNGNVTNETLVTLADKNDVSGSSILTKLLLVDGNGSGLDANYLGGHNAAYFNDAGNLTGTVPTNSLSGSYNITAVNATKISIPRTIAMTGDVSWISQAFDGSANVTGTSTLADSGVTAGLYTSIRVNAKGIVTEGSNIAAPESVTTTTVTTTSISLNDSTTASIQTACTDTSTQVVAMVLSSAYRTIKFLIQTSHSGAFHSTEGLVVHDGTNVSITEYGSVRTGAILATYDSDLNSGYLRILATPVNTNTTIKVIYTAIMI